MGRFKRGVRVRQVRETELVVEVEAETEEEAEIEALKLAAWFCLQARQTFQLNLSSTTWEAARFEALGLTGNDVSQRRAHIDDKLGKKTHGTGEADRGERESGG